MNRLDAQAVPLWDAFTDHPDPEPFDAIPRAVADAVNARSAPAQALCDRMDFRFPDQSADLGDVLWWSRRGAPPPGSRVAERAADPRLADPAADADDRFEDVLEALEDRFPDAYRRFQGER